MWTSASSCFRHSISVDRTVDRSTLRNTGQPNSGIAHHPTVLHTGVIRLDKLIPVQRHRTPGIVHRLTLSLSTVLHTGVTRLDTLIPVQRYRNSSSAHHPDIRASGWAKGEEERVPCSRCHLMTAARTSLSMPSPRLRINLIPARSAAPYRLWSSGDTGDSSLSPFTSVSTLTPAGMLPESRSLHVCGIIQGYLTYMKTHPPRTLP